MSTSRRPAFSFPLIGTLFLLAATLTASRLTEYRKAASLTQPLESIPANLAGFHATENPPLNDNVLGLLKPTSYLSRLYSNGWLRADLFIAYYAQQRAGENMHSPKHCLPGAGWEIWKMEDLSLAVKGQKVTVNKYSISREGERMVVIYWYQSKNRIVASEYLGKLVLARDALLSNSTAGSIVRIIVPDHPSAVEAAQTLAVGVLLEMRRCFGE